MTEFSCDVKVLDFLRWLNAQGGSADAYDEHVDQWVDDREQPDTLDIAISAKLTGLHGEDGCRRLHLLPKGALLLAQSAAFCGGDLTTSGASS